MKPLAQTAAFDAYRGAYADVVQDSVSFSGISYDYFLRSKAALLAQLMGAHFAGQKAPSVLDVGCGIGTLHPLLKPLCGELHGADVSSECVERAAQDNPGVSYRAYSGVTLPHEDNRFDMALAICVMHHVPPADWPAFAAELRRVTRPGGLICVIEHNPLNPVTQLSVMRCPFDEDAVLLRAGETRALLESAGIEDVRSRYFVFAPSTQPWALKLERWLAPAPIGAQYVAYGRA